MTPKTSNKEYPIRYSPRPLETYRGAGQKSEYGPATSSMLNAQNAWNLAYLSYDYDASLQHPDPHFTVNVRRTAQTRLDGSGVDITQSSHPSQLVESLLALPAPRFVHLIMQHPIAAKLPMFQAYGQAWLRTIVERSRVCETDPLLYDAITDFTLAGQVIARVK